MAYVKKNWQNTPSTNTPINADNLNHMEQGIYEAAETADYAKDKVDDLQGLVYSPLVAATAAAMTDTTKVYVYTGSKAGYTSGHWYYYNGSAWADGGVYNSTAFNTDTTLSHPGEAADAEAAGNKIGELKSALNNEYQAFRYKPDMEQGSITSQGVYENNTKTIRVTLDNPLGDGFMFYVSSESGYTYAVRYFDANEDFISGVSFTNVGAWYTVPVGTAKIGLCLRSTSDITPEVQENLILYMVNGDIYDELKNVEYSVYPKLIFEQGNIAQDGTESGNTHVIRTYINDISKWGMTKLRIWCDEGNKYCVRFFASDGTVILAITYTTVGKIYDIPSGCVKIGICIDGINNITPSYGTHLHVSVTADNGITYVLESIGWVKLNFLEFEQGSYSGVDGSPVSDTKTIRTMLPITNTDIEKVRCGSSSGYTYALRFYDQTGTMISAVSFTGTQGDYAIPSGTVRIGICLRYTSDIDISAATNIYFYVPTGSAIQISNNRIDEVAFLGVNVDNTLSQKLAEVIEYNRDQKFVNIGYYTDTHSNVNDASFAIQTMNDIMATKMMNCCIHGGDLITTYYLDYEEYVLEMCKNMIYYKVYGNLLFVKGNHDNNHATVLGDNATKYQYHMMMQSHLLDAVFNPDDPCACYYYYDCDHEKVRVIVLDSFTVEGDSATIKIDDDQLVWLYGTALDVEDGWTVIVFSHMFTDELTKACQIFNAFNDRGTAYGDYEFPNDITTHFVGVVHGHEHTDTSSTSAGFNIIGVTHAFNPQGGVDIFTIDTDVMKLRETRIGYGSDREFDFT